MDLFTNFLSSAIDALHSSIIGTTTSTSAVPIKNPTNSSRLSEVPEGGLNPVLRHALINSSTNPKFFTQDLKSCSLVNHELRHIAQPLMYSQCFIDSVTDKQDIPDLIKLFQTVIRRPDLAKYVKILRVGPVSGFSTATFTPRLNQQNLLSDYLDVNDVASSFLQVIQPLDLH